MTMVISSNHYHIEAHRSYKYTGMGLQLEDNGVMTIEIAHSP